MIHLRGTDTYQLSSGELFDIITDSDGNGSLWVDGAQLTGGKKAGDHYWISADGAWGYLLTSSGDLIISQGSSQDRITLRDWQGSAGNHLGITLDDTPAPVAPQSGALFFTGDQRAKLIGIETRLDLGPASARYNTYAWSETTWAADGTLAGGFAQANFADVIDASAAGTNGAVIHGWGGNDALAGSMGKDDIFGDDGDDLIGGGTGNDALRIASNSIAARGLWMGVSGLFDTKNRGIEGRKRCRRWQFDRSDTEAGCQRFLRQAAHANLAGIIRDAEGPGNAGRFDCRNGDWAASGAWFRQKRPHPTACRAAMNDGNIRSAA